MGVIIKQSIKATAASFIGAFFGFIITMFIETRFLSSEIIGLKKVLFDAASLFCGFAALGCTSSAMRFFPFFKNDKNKDNGFFFYLLLVPTIGLIIFIPIVFLLKAPIVSFFNTHSALFVSYFNWLIPLIVFLVYWITFETYSNVKMRIVVPKIIREIVLRCLLLVLFLLYGFKFIDLTQFITGFVSIYAITALCVLIYISRFKDFGLKHNFSFINNALRNKVFRYTGFMILSTLSGSILGMLDVFMVGSLKGLHFVGIYTIAFYIANVIEMPSRSISAIASPIAAKALKDGDLTTANNLYKKISLNQLLVGSVLFMLIWINIDNIFAIIPNGTLYAQGKWVVLFMGLAKLITITLNFGYILISFSKFYFWGLYFTAFISIIGIVTNLILIPIWGITGAAIATLTTCVLGYSAQQWIVLKKIKGNPYTKNTFKQILIITACIGLNYLLPRWSSSPVVDGFYRTTIIGCLAVYAIYKVNISEDFCRIINNIIAKIKRK